VSDPNVDNLMEGLSKVLEGATVDLQFEALFATLAKMGVVLGTFRTMMVEYGFSGEWIEDMCGMMFYKFFGQEVSEDDDDD
jgi:hypothetical protein